MSNKSYNIPEYINKEEIDLEALKGLVNKRRSHGIDIYVPGNLSGRYTMIPIATMGGNVKYDVLFLKYYPDSKGFDEGLYRYDNEDNLVISGISFNTEQGHNKIKNLAVKLNEEREKRLIEQREFKKVYQQQPQQYQ